MVIQSEAGNQVIMPSDAAMSEKKSATEGGQP
jgi:hypothetical protein